MQSLPIRHLVPRRTTPKPNLSESRRRGRSSGSLAAPIGPPHGRVRGRAHRKERSAPLGNGTRGSAHCGDNGWRHGFSCLRRHQAAAGTPATVSVDPLPTVQINGVVWAQVTVGNTVYATGKLYQGAAGGFARRHERNSPSQSAGLRHHDWDAHYRIQPPVECAGSGDGCLARPQAALRGRRFHDRRRRGPQPPCGVRCGDRRAPDPSFTAGPNGKSEGARRDQRAVYAGGGFSASSNGAKRPNLAAYSSTGLLRPWAPAANGSWPQWSCRPTNPWW